MNDPTDEIMRLNLVKDITIANKYQTLHLNRKKYAFIF